MSMDQLIATVRGLRNRGNYCFLLMRYVDRHLWNEKLRQAFPGYYIENCTDFNYSACFSSILNITPIHASFTSKEYHDYLMAHEPIYSLFIEISAIAPYACVKYTKRTFEPCPTSTVVDSFTPFLPEHLEVGDRVKAFIQNEKCQLLGEAELNHVVEGIELELRKKDVTIYHCLFEDLDN